MRSYRDSRGSPAAVPRDHRRGPETFAVEARDAVRRPRFDGELDVRHAERHVPEGRARWVAAQRVAPRGDHADVFVLDRVGELSALETSLHRGQTARQLVEV